ncbi:glutamine-hydrolyzing carbamoyl-phosphate synthase small subunit [Tistrella mobilis]
MQEASNSPALAATAALVLADGTVFWGLGVGARGIAEGELCFNTSITGYQEILTDPSYAGQIITFTFPHIGNVGTNDEDLETTTPAARGFVLKALPTEPSNFRSTRRLQDWTAAHGLIGIAGVDTRRVTRLLRDNGPQNAVIWHGEAGSADLDALKAQAKAAPSLEGLDLAITVTCAQTYAWDETPWELGQGFGRQESPRFKVVAVDYGAKRNILRCLAGTGAEVVVVPATATADEILAHEPDGIFLSNGPGDPAATGEYAVPQIRRLIETGKPTFGICLGHQLLALAVGASTEKMDRGHRGANQPVKDLTTGKVEITSQNHGFRVVASSLPANAEVTHVSLFDDTLEGFRLTDRPVFAVQYHPEASPGPKDSHYLFDRFARLIEKTKTDA